MNKIENPEPIFMFVKGLDKPLRDVMINSYDRMTKDYSRLYEKDYRKIQSKKLPLDGVKLIIATAIFYQIIIKPLHASSQFHDRLETRFNIGIRIGTKNQFKIDWADAANFYKAFYAICKSYEVRPEYFDFESSFALVKKLTGGPTNGE